MAEDGQGRRKQKKERSMLAARRATLVHQKTLWQTEPSQAYVTTGLSIARILNVCDHVLLKLTNTTSENYFSGIGKLLNQMEHKNKQTNKHWNIQYFRKRNCVGKINLTYFWEPDIPDTMETPECDVVGLLSKPWIMRGRITFHSDFGDLILRWDK